MKDEHFKKDFPEKLRNKVYGIGEDQYHASTVFTQADMMNYQIGNYTAYYPYPFYGPPVDSMMYNQQMPSGYYQNQLRNPMHLNYMRQ